MKQQKYSEILPLWDLHKKHQGMAKDPRMKIKGHRSQKNREREVKESDDVDQRKETKLLNSKNVSESE